MTKGNLRSYLIASLIVVGLLLIVFSIVIPQGTFQFITSKRLGFIADLSGSVSLQGLDQIESSQIKKESSILKFDLIKVGSKSEAVIFLEPTGGEFRISENSEISFELLNENEVLVNIRKGEILIDKFGDNPSFWVQKDGRQLIAKDYALSDEKNSDFLREKGIVLNEANQLSQAKIEEILNSRRGDFFRCYGQLIQRQEQAHGRIVISFEILSSGRVSKAEVSKTDLNDSAFTACLSEVVLRTPFPRFNGQPINTVFPLKFE